jgi:hypothetical protein
LVVLSREGERFSRSIAAGIVERVVAETGDETGKETVGDGTQGAFVLEAAVAGGTVEMSRTRVVSDGGHRPVAEGVAEAAVAGAAHEDVGRLAATAGHRCCAGEGP